MDRHTQFFRRIRPSIPETIANFPEGYHLLRELQVDVRFDPSYVPAGATAITSGSLSYSIFRYRTEQIGFRPYERDSVGTGVVFGFAAINASIAAYAGGSSDAGISFTVKLGPFDELVLTSTFDAPAYGFTVLLDPLAVRVETVKETRMLDGEAVRDLRHHQFDGVRR